ncbi:MAG TPA: CopD family protein [Candidatus Tectomicrobia bacterium]|nr:CopD family protein [Candidatus Tectomicrobia bacterium]
MPALANFLTLLLDRLLFVAYACAAGGLVWSLLLCRPWGLGAPAELRLAHRSMALLRWGAMGMALAQLARLAVQAWLLAELFQRSPFPAFLYTLQCQAGLTRVLLAGLLAAGGIWVERRPQGLLHWGMLGGLAVSLAATGAWLSHAVARDETRAFLMSSTALHHLAVAVWVGGVIQLSLLWRHTRHQPEMQSLWPALVRRFAWVGGPAMLGSLATGLPLAWTYIGTRQGLTGTDYGVMVLIKAVLLVGTLSLATLSFLGARDHRAMKVFQLIPYYVEIETLLLIAIMIVAVGLSAQPPAIDVADCQATGSEVYEAFRPKVPRLTSPSYAEAVAAFPSKAFRGDGVRAGVGSRWSDYNHNVSGLFVVITAMLALASQMRGVPWARHWPVGFIALSVFTVLRSDAGDSWPSGHLGFWEGMLGSDEILLHRLGALIACALGVVEWRARVNGNAGSRLPYVIPGLCAVGGLLLLSHSHTGFQPKEEFLVQISHHAIGVLAVIMACGRWLELRLTPPAGRLAGVVFMSALLLVGLILLFYRETPV